MMKSPESEIHKGHRARMRAKLERHGPSIFDTYELLEMLLYYTIPYKDTNPIAKNLLARFGSIDGIFSADTEELAAECGIGEKCADFIKKAGRLPVFHDLPEISSLPEHFDDYNAVGEFIVSYIQREGASICLLLLDNGMRLINVVTIPGVRFGSAAVKAKAFVDAAMLYRASVVIIGHSHPYGPLFPLESDMVTYNLVRGELAKVGVKIAEHYVVCGNAFMGANKGLSIKVSTNDTDDGQGEEEKINE